MRPYRVTINPGIAQYRTQTKAVDAKAAMVRVMRRAMVRLRGKVVVVEAFDMPGGWMEVLRSDDWSVL